MRLYVYEPGSPGYIRCEFAVAEKAWAEVVAGDVDRRYVYDAPPMGPTSEVLTRDELLAVTTRSRALRAWEEEDDSAYAKALLKQGQEWDARDVRENAVRGCPEAIDLVRRGLPDDETRRFAAEHVCTRHRLTVVK